MPDCCCFDEYRLESVAPGEFALTLQVEGVELLEDVLRDSGLAQGVSSERNWFEMTYNLTGVTDKEALEDFVELMRRTIIVDLKPTLDDCFAVGPYYLFDDGQPHRSVVGNAVNRAKYWGDQAASAAITHVLQRFVARHPRLRAVDAIVVPPKSDPRARNVPSEWAGSVAEDLNVPLVAARKSRPTEPQKEIEDDQDEAEVAGRVAESVSIDALQEGASVLIVDDTLRSGGTAKELARALREAGASRVYGLCVAKDAKFTNGGIDLSRERWQ